MPTLKQMVKQMMRIEAEADDEPGAYPVMFKNDWMMVKFILLLKWEHFKLFVTTSLPRFFRGGEGKGRG